jgi:hypothetical protein
MHSASTRIESEAKEHREKILRDKQEGSLSSKLRLFRTTWDLAGGSVLGRKQMDYSEVEHQA